MMSRELGGLSVLELQTFSDRYGRAFLPYPFRFVKPIPYEYDDELNRYRAELLERSAAGEFDHLRRWLDVQLRDADIRVECLSVNAKDGGSTMMSATRWRDLGFIAQQDSDDNISVTQVSAYELGVEVAKRTALSGRPGSHRRVVIPSVGIRARDSNRSASVEPAIFARDEDDGAVRIEPEELVSGGEVQTVFRRAKRWGRDREKEFIGWVRTTTGDYVVQSPYEFATPTTRTQLAERIDRLISADVMRIREARET